MLEISIKKLVNNALIPERMSNDAAGYDLYSSNTDSITLKKGEAKAVQTGIAVSIPKGYEAQIRPRSGLALKHYITVLNSPGTIDSDYRGEVKVILFNAGSKDYIIEPQTRIAQMVVSRCEELKFLLKKELDETDRGAGGFGHTLLK